MKKGMENMGKFNSRFVGSLSKGIVPAFVITTLALASMPSALAHPTRLGRNHGAASASAAMSGPAIVISDGKAKDTITLNNASGLMSFNGSVGKFSLSISTTPASGLAMLPSFSLNSLTYNGKGKKASTGTITISLSDTSVHPNDGSIASQINGQTTGTVSYSTFADTSNSLFGKGNPLGSKGGLTGAFNINGSAIVASQNAFSLTEMFVIQLGKGGSTHFGATVLDPPIGGGEVAQVPEVGSTLALLGLALLGVEILRRKLTTT
jgi:hypothetical protein